MTPNAMRNTARLAISTGANSRGQSAARSELGACRAAAAGGCDREDRDARIRGAAGPLTGSILLYLNWKTAGDCPDQSANILLLLLLVLVILFLIVILLLLFLAPGAGARAGVRGGLGRRLGLRVRARAGCHRACPGLRHTECAC